MPLPVSDQRRATLRAALGFLQIPPGAPELRLLHRWLDPWAGVGLITVGVERLGYRLSLSHIAEGEWRAQFSKRAGPLSLPRQHHPRAQQVRRGHQQQHLGLVAHAEGIHGLGEPAPEHDPDALALEKPAHHQGLRLIAAAARLDQAVRWQDVRGRPVPGPAHGRTGGGAGREADDLGL